MGGTLTGSKRKHELAVVMMGLDGAGKTTILYKLKLVQVIDTSPTIQFNMESFKYKDFVITVWDLGKESRAFWRTYAVGKRGLIFVVDSSDKERMELAKKELHMAMSGLKEAVVLIYANKSDKSSLDTTELAETLELATFPRRLWHIQSCCGIKGEGLLDGIKWLTESILKRIQ